MATTQLLLTAEEFLRLPDSGQPVELVQGRVVTMNVPAPLHGYICGNVAGLLRGFVNERDLGRVMTNDSGIVTERDPDSVRGADVAFYSFSRLPKGPLPAGYLPVVPELVFEVLSPDDRWREVLVKVSEYLQAGVNIACVLDPDTQTAHVYHAERPSQTITADRELILPGVLDDWRVRVGQFFA